MSATVFIYMITDCGTGSPINGDIMGVYTTLEKAQEAYDMMWAHAKVEPEDSETWYWAIHDCHIIRVPLNINAPEIEPIEMKFGKKRDRVEALAKLTAYEKTLLGL